MNTVQILAQKYQVKLSTSYGRRITYISAANTIEQAWQIGSSRSFCVRVEAKSKILDMIKRTAVKILKASLPALVLFSSATGFARVKDPDTLGKKFQEIAVETVGTGATVKTHILSNTKDEPQILVFTIKYDDKGAKGSATIKYIEGKGAKVTSADDMCNLPMVSSVIKDTLDALDTHAKQLAQK